MKKTIIFLFTFLALCMVSFTPTTVYTVDPLSSPGDIEEVDLKELEDGLKELTMAAFQQEHGRKPETEKELQDFELKLQKDGEQMIEQIIKEGKERGLNEEEALNEFFTDFAKTLQELELADEEEKFEEELPLEEPEPTKPIPTPAIQEKSQEVQTMQEVINQIISALHSFRLKATSNKEMRDNLMMYKYRIDDLIYLLNVISDEQLIQKYFSDPTFAPLVDKLKRLNNQLIEFEDRFVIQEPSLEHDDSAYEVLGLETLAASPSEIIEAYQKKKREFDPSLIRKNLMRQGATQKEISVALNEAAESLDQVNNAYNTLRSQEESKYIFESILSLIDQATNPTNIYGDIKKLLEKYKQDALKEFNEREKIEKEARTAHERSLQMRPFLYPLAEKTFDWPKPSAPSYTPPSFSGSTPSAPSEEKESAREGIEKKAKSGGPKKGGEKKDKKKKEDDAKKKKDEEAKKKEKEEKETKEKKGKSEAPKKSEEKIDKEVLDQLDTVKDLFKQFEKLIVENFNDLQNFVSPYLIQPLIPTATDLEKAKKLQGVIIEMTSKLNSIVKKVKEAFKDDETKRKSFKAAVKKLVDNFNKKLEGTIDDKELEQLKKEIKNVPDIKAAFKKISFLFEVNPAMTIDGTPINNAKKYVFFGEGNKSTLPEEVKKLNRVEEFSEESEEEEEEGLNKKERDILPDEEEQEAPKPEKKVTEEKTTNFIDLLQKSSKNLEELFKK